MNRWALFFVPEAENDLEELSPVIRKRIVKKLYWFRDRFQDITPLTLRHELRGFFKLKMGDWRMIYKIDWQRNKIIIVAIGHRTKIYKRKLI